MRGKKMTNNSRNNVKKMNEIRKKTKVGEMNGNESGRQAFGKWSKGFPCELPETDRQNKEQNLQFRKFLKITKNF